MRGGAACIIPFLLWRRENTRIYAVYLTTADQSKIRGAYPYDILGKGRKYDHKHRK